MVAKKQPFKWPYALRALRHRNFLLFWSGQVISSAGTWLQIVAQGWLVYRLTDSPLMLGLVNLVALIPVVPISLLAGVISDRFPRRTIILLMQVIIMAQVLVLALLTWLNVVEVWHIMILSFGLGAAYALEQPARLAFVLDTVGKEDITNAVGLNSSARSATGIIGPALAGVLVAAFGEAVCFFINGLSYLPVIVALVAIRLPATTVVRQGGDGSHPKVMGSILDGFKYVWNTEAIRALMLLVTVTGFLTLSYVTLLPVFADDVLALGPEGLGFLTGAMGVGAVVGAILVANLRGERQERWLAWGSVATPAFLILFCLSRWFWPSLFLIFLVAAGNTVRISLSNSLLQMGAAPAFHGRVMSLFALSFSGTSRAGAAVAGAAAEFVGVPLAVGVGAALSLLWGIYIVVKMPHASVALSASLER